MLSVLTITVESLLAGDSGVKGLLLVVLSRTKPMTKTEQNEPIASGGDSNPSGVYSRMPRCCRVIPLR